MLIAIPTFIYLVFFIKVQVQNYSTVPSKEYQLNLSCVLFVSDRADYTGGNIKWVLDYMEKNSTRAEFQLGLKFSSRFMSPQMRFLALSNGMKYPMQSQINSDNRLNGFVFRFNCLIFNILYATTLTQVISNFCQSVPIRVLSTVPIRVLSIRSDPGFVNPFRSGFCWCRMNAASIFSIYIRPCRFIK
jgi:hypothetical protein